MSTIGLMMTDDAERLYTVGELSNISGLSKKAIRFYDEKGLLSPEGRDSNNNYRLYTSKQVMDAVTIEKLKKIGFSYVDLKKIFADNTQENIIACINEKISDIETQVVELNTQKLKMERTRAQFIGAKSAYEGSVDSSRGPSISYWPGRRVAYTRKRSSMSAYRVWWERVAELEKIVSENGFLTTGPLATWIHENYLRQFYFDEGDYDIFFPVASDTPLGEYVKDIEGFTVASKVFKGFYGALLPTYISLVKEIEDSDYEICGDPMEEYLLCWTHGISDDDFITRVSFPVRLKSEGESGE